VWSLSRPRRGSWITSGFLCGFFSRCVVRQLQKEQPFIRTKHPPGKLRRPVACLDDTRMLHLFDVLPILRPLHRGEGQLCVLIRGSRACSCRCKRSLIARFGSKHTDHPLLVKGIGFPLQGVTSLACFFGPLDGRIAVKHDRAQKFTSIQAFSAQFDCPNRSSMIRRGVYCLQQNSVVLPLLVAECWRDFRRLLFHTLW
jgi:hypothetical protein